MVEKERHRIEWTRKMWVGGQVEMSRWRRGGGVGGEIDEKVGEVRKMGGWRKMTIGGGRGWIGGK